MEKLKQLVDVKSMVTLGMTAAFIYLAVVGVIDGPTFAAMFTTIIAFYFGTQSKKTEQTSATTNVANSTAKEGVSSSGESK